MTNCAVHVDTPSIGECKLCGISVCTACLTVVKSNVICPECIEGMQSVGDRPTSVRQEAPQPGQRQEWSRAKSSMPDGAYSGDPRNSITDNLEPRSRFLTFILSFLPGLGHLYLGLTRQGLELMGLFFADIVIMAGLNTPFPFAFVIPMLFLYGIFDALQKRDRIAKGIPVNKQATFFRCVDWDWSRKKWIGWSVIVIGALMLLNKMSSDGLLRQFIGDVGDLVVALLLVGLGVWIIFKERSNRHVQSREEGNPDA